MKSSQEVLGLPVLSIAEGKQIGNVSHLVLNPKGGSVEFLLVEDEIWYLGPKIICFDEVQGIGETALTILDQSSLLSVAECEGAIEVLEKNLSLPGIKVLSNKGRFIGTVSEYYVDEHSGEVAGCELIPDGSDKPEGIIPRKLILTFGSEFLVVEDVARDCMLAGLPEVNQAATPDDKPATGTVMQTPEEDENEKEEKKEEPTEALKHFEEQQRQYILGKKVTMRIVADNGEVVAEEGETVTEEIINQARATGKYIQLTLNVRD